MTSRSARRFVVAVSALAVVGLAGAVAAPAFDAATGYDLEPAFGMESIMPARGGLPRRDVPVLLVPGWLDTARDLAALRIRLVGAGWPAEHVETLTFEDPTGSNRDHALELGAAVERLREMTGAGEVDIVAHSMGGLATRWYLREEGEAPIRRVVFLASPHRGTLSAHLAWGGGQEEMMPDSPFLDTLNAEAPRPVGVEVMTIRTVVDTHIVPGESATLPGVVDHELCCPTHAGLLRDAEAFRLILEFLAGR